MSRVRILTARPQRTVAAEDQPLAVGERARLAVGHVVHGDRGRDAAAQRRCLRGHGQELVERPSLVRLEVREPHVAQALDGQDGGHRLPDEREHPAGPVWKSSGSSSTTTYWLQLKPPGTTSTGVLIR